MNDFNIFRNTLIDLLRPKKMIAVLVAAAVPLVTALLWRAVAKGADFVKVDAYNTLSDSLIFGFVLVMLACVFGTNLIAQEIEQKTIVYLLTRPVPRWRILMAKFVAAFVATTLAVCVSAVLLLLGTGAGAHGGAHNYFLRDLAIIPVGALAYGGLFLLFATMFRRPLIVGLLYTFGLESWLPNMPGSFKMLSLMYYVRVLVPHPTSDTDTSSVDVTSPALAWKVLIGVTIVTVIAACAVFSHNEYVPRDDV